jgi:hypothetical protein
MAESFQAGLELMEIKSLPSTVFYFQTDRAIEGVNQRIEAYLSILCPVNPKTCSDMLPFVKFTHNSQNHANRQHSPFELLYGYQPLAIPTALGETNLLAVEQHLKALKHTCNKALMAYKLAQAQTKACFPDLFRIF